MGIPADSRHNPAPRSDTRPLPHCHTCTCGKPAPEHVGWMNAAGHLYRSTEHPNERPPGYDRPVFVFP